MEIAFLILLFIVGCCLGSFLCCQARRLQLRAAKQGSKKLNPRSICLHCKYQLKWYDNLPIISWLLLGGKCRQCGKKIGSAEIISEIGTGLGFLALGLHFILSISNLNIKGALTLASPLDWATLAVVLIFTSVLIFLAIYDGLYGELPTRYLIISIILAAMVLSLQHAAVLITTGFTPELIYQPLLATLVLGGLYLFLYLVSHGKWVGDGDWLLGAAIGIALGDLWLAFIALFLANLLACLYAFPQRQKHSKIHLGPFLVVAFIITFAFANFFQSMI